MGKSRAGKDPGFCLMGTRTLLRSLDDLEDEISGVRKGHDMEAVHKMRVASRRLRAALPMFEPCFKISQYDRWRASTKGITAALGEVRDTDVQLEFLGSFLQTADATARPGVEAILALKKEARGEMQSQVRGWLENLTEEGTLADMRFKLEKISQKAASETVTVRTRESYSAALAHVTARIRDLIKLEDCVTSPDDHEKHHEMRIAAKRLRYTIEIFKVLFDDEVRAEIQTMKGIQDLLGEMHDCDVWTTTLPNMLCDSAAVTGIDQTTIQPGLDALLADRHKVRGEKYAEFVVQWNDLRRRRFFENIENRFQTELMLMDMSRSFLDSLTKSGKLAMVSDIHGNLDALKAVIKDAKDNGISAFLNAGDMVGSGAYPEEVVSMVKGSMMVSVAGNFDLKVLEFARASQRPSSRSIKRAIVAAAARDLSDESMEFLSSLPTEQRMELNGKRLLMVHASPADPDEHLGPGTEDSRLSELTLIADADIIVVGHSHIPFTKNVKDVLFINPGSVGRPGDHDPRASYAILDIKTFAVEIRRVEYDVESAANAIQEKGIPEVIANMIRKGLPSSEVQEMRPRKKAVSNVHRNEIVEREARRLNIDHQHAEHVMKLAMDLFKGLKPLHGLGSEDRFLLEAGCLLHDIGLADGDKAHNRASYRMIMTEPTLPFNDRERQMVACLARYHRKRPPKDEDDGFSALAPEDRLRVRKLAAILRVADGLDYRHSSNVRTVKCKVSDKDVSISCGHEVDISAEIEAAMVKSDLFTETFARELIIS